MLIKAVIFRFILNSGRITITATGINITGDSLNPESINLLIEGSISFNGCVIERTAYMMLVIATGTIIVFTISLTFVFRSVFVTNAVSDALADTGEQRSPKYPPERTAPAVIKMLTSPALAIATSMIPIVPATPKHEPSAYENTQHITNASSRNIEGVMSMRP